MKLTAGSSRFAVRREDVRPHHHHRNRVGPPPTPTTPRKSGPARRPHHVATSTGGPTVRVPGGITRSAADFTSPVSDARALRSALGGSGQRRLSGSCPSPGTSRRRGRQGIPRHVGDQLVPEGGTVSRGRISCEGESVAGDVSTSTTFRCRRCFGFGDVSLHVTVGRRRLLDVATDVARVTEVTRLPARSRVSRRLQRRGRLNEVARLPPRSRFSRPLRARGRSKRVGAMNTPPVSIVPLAKPRLNEVARLPPCSRFSRRLQRRGD